MTLRNIMMSHNKSHYHPIRFIFDLKPNTKSIIAVRAFASSRPLFNMPMKHLATGSPLPSFTGKLRFYSCRFCPFAQRVHLVLEAKNVPHEVILVNLTDYPEWFASKNSQRKVPVLEIKDGVTIVESLVGASYVDEAYPEKTLTAQDPLRRAQDKIILENFGKVFPAFYRVIFQKHDASKEIFDALEELQNEMIKRKTKFLHGDTPGFLDYMIWPIFERLVILQKQSEIYKIDENKFSTIFKWIAEMKKDPAVKKYYLDPEIHYKYLMGHVNGDIKYDGLI